MASVRILCNGYGVTCLSGRPRGGGAKRPATVTEVLRPAKPLPVSGSSARRRRVSVRNVAYRISPYRTEEKLHVITGAETISFFAVATGELIAEQPLPEPGTRYVGNGLLGRAGHSSGTTSTAEVSPIS